MLDIKQIESFYPEYQRPFQRNLLREYLQYKILESIYSTEVGQKLIFMGGTAIHLIHGNTRFSEDLDFDNLGIDASQFRALTTKIMTALKRNGYILESRTVCRRAFRSYLKFSDLLYELNISRHRKEKLSIQIDSEPQGFLYEPDKVLINKFDVLTRINVVPPDILLAQKLYCLFTRPRLMGRDIYDAVFLFGKTDPNMDYMLDKMRIKTKQDLKNSLSERCQNISLEQLAQDVQPFLYNPKDALKIIHFPELIKLKL